MNPLNYLWSGANSPPTTPPPGLPLAGKLSGNDSRKGCQLARQTWRQPSPHYALATVLGCARKPMSITELAEAMGVSVGESSKRVKAARSFVRTKRDGRRKLVSLKRDIPMSEWLALFEPGRPS